MQYTIQIPEELDILLDKIAAEKKMAKAEIIRQAILKYRYTKPDKESEA